MMKASVLTTVAALVLLAGALPAEAAKAPVGKTYFVISIGVATDEAEAYEREAGCLRFTRTELCDTGGDCGAWWRVRDANRLKKQWQVGYEFELIDDETGLPIRIQGLGRIDTRGPKSSIGGTAHGVELTSGETINFAIAGRAVGRARCEQMVADFAAARQ